jgi:hypothetical protein
LFVRQNIAASDEPRDDDNGFTGELISSEEYDGPVEDRNPPGFGFRTVR